MDSRKRRKPKNKRPATAVAQQKPRSRMIFDDVEVPQVVEPRPSCSICGQPIESIIEAISEPDGGLSHFDCVLEKLREREHVQEPDSISYIGHGNFAVVTKDEEGRYSIKYRIQYESNDDYANVKRQVEESKK